ncbi:MAG: hypothetical protein IPI35_33705 [Deltaproteobacteria bacterium]|nr:hypothetical protein [Deltaproteobacteria bacterium]
MIPPDQDHAHVSPESPPTLPREIRATDAALWRLLGALGGEDELLAVSPPTTAVELG